MYYCFATYTSKIERHPALSLRTFDDMHKSHSINDASSPRLSLSLPLLADPDSSRATDADHISTGVTSARWWILFQYCA